MMRWLIVVSAVSAVSAGCTSPAVGDGEGEGEPPNGNVFACETTWTCGAAQTTIHEGSACTELDASQQGAAFCDSDPSCGDNGVTQPTDCVSTCTSTSTCDAPPSFNFSCDEEIDCLDENQDNQTTHQPDTICALDKQHAVNSVTACFDVPTNCAIGSAQCTLTCSDSTTRCTP